MNIFFLDQDPQLAAQAHADMHVGKMMTESAQLLFTSFAMMTQEPTPWKPTHRNHVCTLWLTESFANWTWLRDLQFYLQHEWNHRWPSRKQVHGSFEIIRQFQVDHPHWDDEIDWYASGITRPALAMPKEFQRDDAVESYREYYRKGKIHLHSWTRRGEPSWL